jgi:hypothetical protein
MSVSLAHFRGRVRAPTYLRYLSLIHQFNI